MLNDWANIEDVEKEFIVKENIEYGYGIIKSPKT